MNKSSIHWTSFFLAITIALLFKPIANARPEQQFKNMREALQALRSAKNPAEAEEIRATLSKVPVDGHDDLIALYDAAKKGEDTIPPLADFKTASKYGREIGTLVERLRGCTAANLQDDISSLLAKENAVFEQESHLPASSITPSVTVKNEIREERVRALMDAAGAGKNTKARDALWKTIELEHDGNYGQLAALSLGRIGDSRDLDRLLGMLISNPKLRLSLKGFGALVAPRVVKGITAVGITPEVKARLSLELRESSTHDNIGAYIPLLKHTDPIIAQAASEAIDKSLQSADQDLIEAKLKSPSAYDRAGVIIAVGNHAWSDKYIPLLVTVLQQDSDVDNRGLAAKYLGLHHAQSALSALKDASTKDLSSRVRLAASVAVDRITKAK